LPIEIEKREVPILDLEDSQKIIRRKLTRRERGEDTYRRIFG
jgi:hypothetical protein